LEKLFWCRKSVTLNIKKRKHILIGESYDWAPAKCWSEMMPSEQSDKVHATVKNAGL